MMYVLRIRNAASSGTVRLPLIQRCRIRDPTSVYKQYHVQGRPAPHLKWYGVRHDSTSPLARDALCPLSRNYHKSLSLRSRAFSSTYISRLFSKRTAIALSTTNRAASDDAAGSAAANQSAAAGSKGGGDEGDFELVYRGPLRSAVRAVKVFSLTTCAVALVGGPILVLMGNPSVPLIGRVLMTSIVMTVGISTTLILHWLMKGYVIEMYFDPKSEHLRVYTLTMLAGKRCHTFHLSEAGPPESLTAFSTFQAQGRSFFMHTEVLENKELLGKILGAYMALENREFWEHDKTSASSNTKQDKTL